MTHPLALPAFLPVTMAEVRAARIDGAEPARGQVLLAPYDPDWSRWFAAERDRIVTALGVRALRVEHVGSTSVPGLPAKPIIDIDLVVADSADETAWLPALEAVGYWLHLREPDWYEHRLLKGPEHPVNLHVFSYEPSAEWRRNRVFRDWLRDHEDDRSAYAARKAEAAGNGPTYTFEYNNAKAGLIHEIYARALAADAAAGYPSLG